MVVGFLCKVSVVLIIEEVVVMLIRIVAVVMVEHVFMTVGVITVGIRSVGVKTIVLGVIQIVMKCMEIAGFTIVVRRGWGVGWSTTAGMHVGTHRQRKRARADSIWTTVAGT